MNSDLLDQGNISQHVRERGGNNVGNIIANPGLGAGEGALSL